MSMTKAQFDDEINSSYQPDYSDWQSYEEYLYQQFGYDQPVDDMYTYLVAQQLIASRREENAIEIRPLVLSPLRNGLQELNSND